MEKVITEMKRDSTLSEITKEPIKTKITEENESITKEGARNLRGFFGLLDTWDRQSTLESEEEHE